VRAVEAARETVVIPLGILEKHGPHLPLGTDLLDAREVALRAARQEYAVVFPSYYFGQIYEAQHQPGTMAYSPKLIWDVLQETCDQLARNGFRRIVLVNGHGGNTNFLQFFVQAQLERRRPYAVFLYAPEPDAQAEQRLAALRKTEMDMHAGETETSMLLAHRPDLVRLERAGQQSGADQKRLDTLRDAYTGIWWYARFPNHYAGDGRPANRELGEALLAAEVEPLVRLLRTVKADETTRELQERFFDQAQRPLETAQ
jgi:creatinine amidohydrolase